MGVAKKLANEFGLSRQRVYQLIKEQRLKEAINILIEVVERATVIEGKCTTCGKDYMKIFDLSPEELEAIDYLSQWAESEDDG